MGLQYPNVIQAAGKISAVGVVAWEAGGSMARTALGVFQLTLDQPTDANQCLVQACLTGPAAAADTTINVEDVSDTIKQVTITQAGVGVDAGFSWTVLRAPN